jgi:hypothetical protein
VEPANSDSVELLAFNRVRLSKDGAKSAPTTLTQITDACAAMLQTYEDLWKKAQIER